MNSKVIGVSLLVLAVSACASKEERQIASGSYQYLEASQQKVLEVPAELTKYLASKGSITVDGVSLTANQVSGQIVSLNVVPHTAEETIIMNYKVSDKVHVEVDVIARYLEKLMLGQAHEKTSMLSEGFLAQHGYMK